MKTTRVIIVGAGLGGLSAAWQLTKDHPDLQVDVYEASWVPGGKAASGRPRLSESSSETSLIEEHGLHMLFGTYHETWRMLADCYAENDLPVTHAFRRIEQAFTPGRRVVFDQAQDGGWPREHWVFCPEENPGRPWDGAGVDAPLDDVALRAVACCGIQRHTVSLANTTARLRGPAVRPQLDKPATFFPSELEEGMLREDLREWSNTMVAACAPARRDNFWLLSQRLPIEQILRLATNARRLGEIIDLGLAVLAGTEELRTRCGCQVDACRCFDHLNEFDLRDWLKTHGWDSRNDAIIRGFYAGLFARPGELAAGVGLRAMLRVLFDYRGTMVYRMEAGMGEVVIAPLYRALQARGVRFHFLERLSRLSVTDGRISGLTFERLGNLRPDYSPVAKIETVHGTLLYLPDSPPGSIGLPDHAQSDAPHMHRVWPTAPIDSHEVPVADHAHVIIAIPPAAIRPIAGPLRSQPAWAAFLDGPSATRSAPIASVQLWRKHSDPDRNPIRRGVAAGHTPPFDVWADMSHLLSRESATHDSTDIGFFCGRRQGEPIPNQADEIARVEEQFEGWLAHEATHMLGRPVDLDHEEVHRYVAANLDPSDEYVLSCPNTIAHRIRPDDTGFANLGIAGDWVKNDLDCGCVESAVTGGILAAKSIP